MKLNLPKDFIWGTATAAHQVEGNNTNSDFWLLENTKNTVFVEPSGITCDQWNRYEEDIKLMAECCVPYRLFFKNKLKSNIILDKHLPGTGLLGRRKYPV